MGTQLGGGYEGGGGVVKVEPEGVAMSLDHCSTTVSDGGSPPQLEETSDKYVSEVTDCIPQKRRLGSSKLEPIEIDDLSPDPAELEDAESPPDEAPWMSHNDNNNNNTGGSHNHTVPAAAMVNHQAPIDNHQAPIVNHQAPIVNHQAPIDNHQAPIVNHQAPIFNHQAPIFNHQAPIFNHQAPIVNHQAPIFNHQAPIVNHQAPIVNHQAPIFNHQAPIFNHQAPIFNHQAPIVNHQAPIVNHQAPIVNHQAPIVNHQAPIVIPNPPFFNWPPRTTASSSSGPIPMVVESEAPTDPQRNECRQFWKAGDYDALPAGAIRKSRGIDHVRVHPKFLHSNATSHKWVLGAIAELLDNAMDEVMNGATFVSVDMLRNPVDNSPMLCLEDDGGGMDPDRLRECMSLGYSTKTKGGNTIGQYGNGFKTSTMRLGADVLVFTRSPRTAVRKATQSIGLLSFTFLRERGHEEIIVPMVDYEVKDGQVSALKRSTDAEFFNNLKTITEWCPFKSEPELFTQFISMTTKGTKVIVYNLWEDEYGKVELDFESDPHDIRLRSMDSDPRKIAMAQRYTYSKHYLTYHHSLRSYAAILYYRLPPGFHIILRGKEVPHHNMAEDLMETQELSYKPQGFESSRNLQMVANVVMGFVKDAYEHIDVQGFNVYHKNRLIKPFWKVWNTAGSDGRGIVGVLEANFVAPAHDKQSFERTTVLARLELRLQQMQKAYWAHNCHLVGYVNKKLNRRRLRQAAAETSELNSPGGQVGRSPIANQDSLQPRLSVPGFPVNTTRVDVASPAGTSDMGFHLVYRNRPSPNPAGPPGFHLSFELPVDRSGPSTPEVTAPYKNFLWQGPESDMRESPGDNKSRENLPTGFETLQMLRNGAVDPATLQAHLASANGQGQPYDLEISAELEENELLRARLKQLEQDDGSLNFEIERNRKLEAQILDLEQQEAVDRRSLEQCTRERDSVQAALAEERRVHYDEDLRNNLKAAILRARELEADNQRLRLKQQQQN